MAGDNEMGDDLERAAKAFHAWVEREEGAAPWGEMCADGHTIIRQGASETLLSFLDMDETGVERITSRSESKTSPGGNRVTFQNGSLRIRGLGAGR